MEDITSWTSIDLYYKGFHIKKSLPQNVNRVTLMAEIDDLIQAGFKPSWNESTNSAQSSVKPVGASSQRFDKVEPEDEYVVKCKGCGASTTYKQGVNKETGKPWKGYFCDDKCGAKPHFVK